MSLPEEKIPVANGNADDDDDKPLGERKVSPFVFFSNKKYKVEEKIPIKNEFHLFILLGFDDNHINH